MNPGGKYNPGTLVELMNFMDDTVDTYTDETTFAIAQELNRITPHLHVAASGSDQGGHEETCNNKEIHSVQ